jgi:hypothetical protein
MQKELFRYLNKIRRKWKLMPGMMQEIPFKNLKLLLRSSKILVKSPDSFDE